MRENQSQSLSDYLKKKLSPSTVYSYHRNILLYLKEQPNAEKANYKEIVNYIGQLRNRYIKGNTVKSILNSIKKYYEYLAAAGKRKDHPCRNLNIKDKLHKDIQLQDLLTEKELENILHYQSTRAELSRSKRFKEILEIRDKALLSLLVHQGLTKGELKRLTVSDLNLESGNIYIKSSKNSNSRTLELKSHQILLLHKYLHETRPQLLGRKKLPSSNSQLRTSGSILPSLFITTKGQSENGDSLKYIFGQMNKSQGRKITISLIRQSVIALKLKQGNDIRIVQNFAGHKNASSTERYKAADIEELKAGINKYHPLK